MEGVRFVDSIKHRGLQLPNMVVLQNLLLHHMGVALHDDAVLLREYVHVVGNPLTATVGNRIFSEAENAWNMSQLGQFFPQ